MAGHLNSNTTPSNTKANTSGSAAAWAFRASAIFITHTVLGGSCTRSDSNKAAIRGNTINNQYKPLANNTVNTMAG